MSIAVACDLTSIEVQEKSLLPNCIIDIFR